jgi:hypothetical protein
LTDVLLEDFAGKLRGTRLVVVSEGQAGEAQPHFDVDEALLDAGLESAGRRSGRSGSGSHDPCDGACFGRGLAEGAEVLGGEPVAHDRHLGTGPSGLDGLGCSRNRAR